MVMENIFAEYLFFSEESEEEALFSCDRRECWNFIRPGLPRPASLVTVKAKEKKRKRLEKSKKARNPEKEKNGDVREAVDPDAGGEPRASETDGSDLHVQVLEAIQSLTRTRTGHAQSRRPKACGRAKALPRSTDGFDMPGATSRVYFSQPRLTRTGHAQSRRPKACGRAKALPRSTDGFDMPGATSRVYFSQPRLTRTGHAQSRRPKACGRAKALPRSTDGFDMPGATCTSQVYFSQPRLFPDPDSLGSRPGKKVLVVQPQNAVNPIHRSVSDTAMNLVCHTEFPPLGSHRTDVRVGKPSLPRGFGPAKKASFKQRSENDLGGQGTQITDPGVCDSEEQTTDASEAESVASGEVKVGSVIIESSHSSYYTDASESQESVALQCNGMSEEDCTVPRHDIDRQGDRAIDDEQLHSDDKQSEFTPGHLTDLYISDSDDGDAFHMRWFDSTSEMPSDSNKWARDTSPPPPIHQSRFTEDAIRTVQFHLNSAQSSCDRIEKKKEMARGRESDVELQQVSEKLINQTEDLESYRYFDLPQKDLPSGEQTEPNQSVPDQQNTNTLDFDNEAVLSREHSDSLSSNMDKQTTGTCLDHNYHKLRSDLNSADSSCNESSVFAYKQDKDRDSHEMQQILKDTKISSTEEVSERSASVSQNHSTGFMDPNLDHNPGISQTSCHQLQCPEIPKESVNLIASNEMTLNDCSSSETSNTTQKVIDIKKVTRSVQDWLGKSPTKENVKTFCSSSINIASECCETFPNDKISAGRKHSTGSVNLNTGISQGSLYELQSCEISTESSNLLGNNKVTFPDCISSEAPEKSQKVTDPCEKLTNSASHESSREYVDQIKSDTKRVSKSVPDLMRKSPVCTTENVKTIRRNSIGIGCEDTYIKPRTLESPEASSSDKIPGGSSSANQKHSTTSMDLNLDYNPGISQSFPHQLQSLDISKEPLNRLASNEVILSQGSTTSETSDKTQEVTDASAKLTQSASRESSRETVNQTNSDQEMTRKSPADVAEELETSADGLTWTLNGENIIQLEGLPGDADLTVLEELVASCGTILQREVLYVDTDKTFVRYRMESEDVCNFVTDAYAKLTQSACHESSRETVNQTNSDQEMTRKSPGDVAEELETSAHGWTWTLNGENVIQLEGLPGDADLTVLEELVASCGTILQREVLHVDKDEKFVRYRLESEDVCNFAVDCLHNSECVYPDSSSLLICSRI